MSKIIVTKQGFNPLTETNPKNKKFSTEYGTLKYFTKQSINTSFDANAGDISSSGSYTHNLGYYPYVEVFVSVYIGSPTGVYEYCPFFGSGTVVEYSANYRITNSQIICYGEINGVSTSVWHFDFIIFIYKNDLHL